MRLPLLAVLVLAAGCRSEESNGDPRTEAPGDQTMVGAWDAQLSLTSAYQLAARAPAARVICGTIGFVDNRHGPDPRRRGVDIGVYDLDLSRLGLNWIADNSYPAAVASTAHQSRATTRGDSVTIVLNPGSSERIVLSGTRDALGVAGDWLAQSQRGTATGRFALKPHSLARPAC